MSEKKKELLKSLLYVGGIVCLFSCLFLGKKAVEADDLSFHMYRLIGDYHSWLDGQLLPRIYPYANNGYGYGSPLFYSDLFLYPFAIWLKVKIPFPVIFQMMTVFYSFVAGCTAFYTAKKIAVRKSTPYFISFLYVFSAYHIYDVYSRAAFGEILAICFYPLVFLAAYRLLIKRENTYLLLGSSYGLMLMSHLISFFWCVILLGAALLIFFLREHGDCRECARVLRQLLYAILLGLALSCFYWLPMLEQFLSQDFLSNHLSDYYRPEQYSLSWISQLNPLSSYPRVLSDEIFESIHIGQGILLLPLVGLFLQRKKATYLFLTGSGYFFWVMAMGFPLISWRFLRFMQFPFRYFLPAYPLLIFGSLFVVEELKEKVARKLMLIAVALSLTNFISYAIAYKQSENSFAKDIGIEEYYRPDKNSTFDYDQKTLSGGEYLPVPNVNDFLRDEIGIYRVNEKREYEILLYTYERNFTDIRFTYFFEEPCEVMFPLSYYKGYRVTEITEDGQKEVASFSSSPFHKVAFMAEAGERSYRVHYEGTLWQKWSILPSVLSFFYILWRGHSARKVFSSLYNEDKR